MRIAELSRRTGIPVPTIKYYLREGLLPPGELSSPNQARYDERHVRRLQLVRALLEFGRLPIATIKEILSELDHPDPDLHRALGHVTKAAGDERQEPTPQVDELIDRHGWDVGPHAPARKQVADVIAALQRLGAQEVVDRLDDYAALAQRLADIDLATIGKRTEPEEIIHGAVVGMVLGDALLAGLRRLAQESASAKIYGVRKNKEN